MTTPQLAGGTPYVVVGYDGGEAAGDALTLGVRLARALTATALVVTVHPDSPPGMGHVDAEWAAAVREQAAAILAQARERLAGVEAVDFRVTGSGSAAHGLDDLATSVGAAALVVGSGHGGPLRRLLAGNTGQRLLQGAAVPVVVAPRGAPATLADPVQVIGCAFVDTPDGAAALRFAADLAARSGARLRVFSVVAVAEDFATFGGMDARRLALSGREQYQQALTRAVDALGSAVPVTAELLEGEAVPALAALDDRDVDLLVCGSRGYGPVRRVLLGGTSARLVRHAAAPVLVVPREGEPA